MIFLASSDRSQGGVDALVSRNGASAGGPSDSIFVLSQRRFEADELDAGSWGGSAL